MGCAPSLSSILVEQQHFSPERKSQNQEAILNPAFSLNDSFVEKSFSPEEEFLDEGFLQESIKSGTPNSSIKSITSWDSGMYELDNEYSHIITENSDPSIVQEVNSQFIPGEGRDLLLVGKACPRKLSSKDRDKMDQQAILDVLKGEGLVIRPGSKTNGGIRLDYISSQNSISNGSPLSHKLPPINIRKKYRRKSADLTYEEIRHKLTQAEERRKRRIEEKIGKFISKDRQEIQAKAQEQTEINRQMIEEKLFSKIQSRKRHLLELKEKLKAREEHAKKVRERKLMQENGFKYIMSSLNE